MNDSRYNSQTFGLYDGSGIDWNSPAYQNIPFYQDALNQIDLKSNSSTIAIVALAGVALFVLLKK